MTDASPEIFDSTDFAVREHRSLWVDAWRRMISNNTARLGMAIVTIFILSAVLSHFFWEYDPRTDIDYSLKLKPPNLIATEEIPSIHPFGTDKLGRDIFRRVVHGGWNSLRVGLVAVAISLSIGGILGMLAGFYDSMPISRAERIFLLGGIGLVLGSLSAWIAGQPLQMILFAGLGISSAYWEDLLKGQRLRTLLFALLGALIGGILGFLANPYVGIVCGVLGLFIGWILSMPMGGQVLTTIIMRAMDILLAFPTYLLAIAIVAFLGPGLEKGMIAIGVVGIPIYARLVRSTVLSVIQKEYILAAQATGEGHGRIMFRHILPNTLSPVIVQTTMGLAGAILAAAALGFLGLGAIPPEPEWGSMLGASYRYLASGAWWAVIFPGLAIMLSVLGFNLLGDGLRDALDPKLQV
jgi:ABC-type dipeptide/oligopeptide/nickel transport system permease subunit